MKFSYNWIAELVPGLTADAKTLGREITLRTAECEGVEPHAPHLAEVCVARVVSVEAIPKSPNVKAVVETGRYGARTVVCGAPNCRAGLLTAYWPLGVKKIAGVQSDGMLCAGDELGINRDHDLIVELSGVEPGDAIPGIQPDHVIEIDNKSLTHRPDLWGHLGMAREVCADLGFSLNDPVEVSMLPSAVPLIPVAVEDHDLCPRFSAVYFENVKVGPSPLWLQYRLETVGLNPINNIVDITNYVMAELPQPMHAFDAGKVTGHSLTARAARDGETCAALNGETYDLDPSMIVVAGKDGPLAIAGVMGGASSMIDAGTTKIIFEAANWHPASVRKTAAKLKLRTDASMRFEKALDPENTVRGLARAIALMKRVCPEARLVGGVADVYRPFAKPQPIFLAMDWLQKKLGRSIELNEVARILGALGFGCESRTGGLAVTVPSWRATKDISMADDLVEEVGRVIGYGTIAPVAPRVDAAPPPINATRTFHNRVRRSLAACGFTEVQNYSFVSDAEAVRLGFDPATHVRVLNPIAEDQALLRVSLVPKALRNIEENRKHLEAFRFCEIGNEIHKRTEGLPDEVPHLVAAVYAKDDGLAGMNELKRVAAMLPGVEFRPVSETRIFEHPARTAEVYWQRERIGRLFEFHPSFVEQGRAAVLDLDLHLVQELDARTAKKYRPISKFPSSSFDLSVVVQSRVLVGDVQKLVPDAEFVDDYALPDGRRSLLFRMTVANDRRTLTGEEVSAERQRCIDTLRGAGYELRV